MKNINNMDELREFCLVDSLNCDLITINKSEKQVEYVLKSWEGEERPDYFNLTNSWSDIISSTNLLHSELVELNITFDCDFSKCCWPVT